jgi:hypothetical protein
MDRAQNFFRATKAQQHFAVVALFTPRALQLAFDSFITFCRLSLFCPAQLPQGEVCSIDPPCSAFLSVAHERAVVRGSAYYTTVTPSNPCCLSHGDPAWLLLATFAFGLSGLLLRSVRVDPAPEAMAQPVHVVRELHFILAQLQECVATKAKSGSHGAIVKCCG